MALERSPTGRDFLSPKRKTLISLLHGGIGGRGVILGFAMIATCLTNPPIEWWSPLPNSIYFRLYSFSFWLLGMEHDEERRGKSQGGKSKEEEKLLR